jgi:hypothetical protein
VASMAAGKEALTYSKLEDLSHKKREIFLVHLLVTLVKSLSKNLL